MHLLKHALLHAALVIGLGVSDGAQADTLSLVHSFRDKHGGGTGPIGALVEASDGHLYGATYEGGRFDAGTIYRIRSDGIFETLTGFGLLEGAQPVGGLVEGSDGALYGVTRFGGAFNDGVIFRMTTAGETTVLHSFDLAAWGGLPTTGLTLGNDGYLYGALSGGDSNVGHIYRISESGEFSLVSPLDGTTCDRFGETGPLTEGEDGRFYGTIASGGGVSCIFRASKQGGTTILYRFSGSERPSRVIVGHDGLLYGTAMIIGAVDLCGYVYRLEADRTITRLHEFRCRPYRQLPYGALVQGQDGLLRGFVDTDGIDDIYGSVYQLATDGTGFSQKRLDRRAGPSRGPLIEAGDGNFYAPTAGGRYKDGAVLRVTPEN